MSMAHRSGPVIGTSGRPLEPVVGIKWMPKDWLGPLLTVVSQEGFGFRHLARSRSGQLLIGVPAQPAAVHLSATLLEPKLLSVAGTSRGYSTAARALVVGKSYAPSAPRAGLRTPDAEAAEGLRLAVVVGRGARGQKARALSISTHTPKGSAVFSSHACSARSC